MSEFERPPLKVQSLRFSKRHGWTDAGARRWLASHGYRGRSVDVTRNELRYRQREPDAFDPDTFVTVVFGDGIEAVMAKVRAKGKPMARRTPRRDSKGRFIKSGHHKSRKSSHRKSRKSARRSSRKSRKRSHGQKTLHVKRGSRVTIVAR